MQLKLVKIFVCLLFPAFFNTAFCQGLGDKATDITETENVSQCEKLSVEFNSRATSSEFLQIRFYSRVKFDCGFKTRILDFVNLYPDRIYKINFSPNTFDIQVSQDLEKKELYKLFISNGFDITLVNENNDLVKLINNEEVIIPGK